MEEIIDQVVDIIDRKLTDISGIELDAIELDTVRDLLEELIGERE